MSKFDPNLASQGDENFDRLFAGDFPRHETTVTLATGQGVLARGTVLGEGAGGEYFVVDDGTAADGREDPLVILAEEADTSSGAVDAPAYESGAFNRAELVVDGSTTVAAQEAALRDRSIFVKDTVSR